MSVDRRQFIAGTAGFGIARSRPLPRPNFVLILTDDQAHAAWGASGNPAIQTPNMDAFASWELRFTHAFVTTAICSANPAALLTGRYGRFNGGPGLDGGLFPTERTIGQVFSSKGYFTGHIGKWHLKLLESPEEGGFEWATWFYSNGPHYDRKVIERGRERTVSGYLKSYNVNEALRFLDIAAKKSEPFSLTVNTQSPHMDHCNHWSVRESTVARYKSVSIPMPLSFGDNLSGKPEYLRTFRNRRLAEQSTCLEPQGLEEQTRRYYGCITELDEALRPLFQRLRHLAIDNTYVIFTSDNGWFMGEHGFLSQRLAYEESMRVPSAICGLGIRKGSDSRFILNVNLTGTLYDLAGIQPPKPLHGQSLRLIPQGKQTGWRSEVLYEALSPTLLVENHIALRTKRWKLIHTLGEKGQVIFKEIYDLTEAPAETKNLAAQLSGSEELVKLRELLAACRADLDQRR